MAERDLTEQVFEAYLDAVGHRLAGPRTIRAAILDELRDGLHAAAATRTGLADPAAATIADFGSPAVVAAAFAGELAEAQARSTVRGYLMTGPPIGVLWVLAMAAGRSPLDVLAGWRLVPPVPVIAIAVLVAVLVLLATGRASRWVQVRARRVADAGITVVVATVLGDLLMLAVATPTLPHPVPVVGLVAIVASGARLGFAVPQLARNRRSRRALSAEGVPRMP
jgi:hypothetical protein